MTEQTKTLCQSFIALLLVHTIIYRENFNQVDGFTATRFPATGAYHASFADASACLTGDNVWNEGK
jgi:hypothetical protein